MCPFHWNLERLCSRHGKLTPGAQLCTVEVQQPDANDANHAQATEETSAPGNTQVPKQRMRKQDAAARQGTPEEVVRREQTSRVHWVGERDVDKDALHDDEDRAPVDGDADRRHDPVDGGSGRPGEEEEADGRAEGHGQGGDEAVLLGWHAVLDDAWVLVVVQPRCVDGHAEDAGYQHAEEDEADLAEVHAVVHGVYEREDLEDW